MTSDPHDSDFAEQHHAPGEHDLEDEVLDFVTQGVIALGIVLIVLAVLAWMATQ